MKAKLELGADIEFLTAGELDQSLDRAMAQARANERERIRGIKYRRLPQLAGQASGGVLNIGGDVPTGWNGQAIGPTQGNAWDIGLLAVSGLTTGTTPDVVNLYIRGAGSTLAWWQFNGNNFAYSWGRGALVILPGETLQLVSVGTFAATGTITLFGSIRGQAPVEMLSKELA